MKDLLRTPSADRTQDYELEGFDFFSPVQAMGAYASKDVAPEITPEQQDEPYEVWGFGD